MSATALGRCDSVIKNTPLWNSTKATAAYFIFIRNEPKEDGTFICPVSEFVGRVFPHLRNRNNIVLLALEDLPNIPVTLTEVPSVLHRETPTASLKHLYSKESLRLWLQKELCDTATARNAWTDAEQLLNNRFRQISIQQAEAVRRANQAQVAVIENSNAVIKQQKRQQIEQQQQQIILLASQPTQIQYIKSKTNCNEEESDSDNEDDGDIDSECEEDENTYKNYKNNNNINNATSNRRSRSSSSFSGSTQLSKSNQNINSKKSYFSLPSWFGWN